MNVYYHLCASSRLKSRHCILPIDDSGQTNRYIFRYVCPCCGFGLQFVYIDLLQWKLLSANDLGTSSTFSNILLGHNITISSSNYVSITTVHAPGLMGLLPYLLYRFAKRGYRSQLLTDN
ncbi:hypothetical protein BJ165DRAFT_319106 [Panaeolus papilionaceus]|nr:hypothetical protein BJ165DRAFT_319106 [Panaeolus papilionaceus]